MVSTKSATKEKVKYSRHHLHCPIKEKDIQNVGEFIADCKNKSTKGIYDEIKSSKNHIIHSYLEWDDTIAGNKYRLQQVRNIIEKIVIVLPGKKQPIRAFYSIVAKGSNKSIYIDLRTLGKSGYAKAQIIRRAKNELRAWTNRYEMYQELDEVISFIRRHL